MSALLVVDEGAQIRGHLVAGLVGCGFAVGYQHPMNLARSVYYADARLMRSSSKSNG